MDMSNTVGAGTGAGNLVVQSIDRAFWESRSAEQLREILDRGLAAGDAFTGASAEIERRARETARRARESSTILDGSRVRRVRAGKVLVLASAAVGAAATAIYWVIR